uniref:40S ribosomal protein S12 n=2 Tax=Loa loa TaxID=7209 RepID=A0A1I7VML7_LOALO
MGWMVMCCLDRFSLQLIKCTHRGQLLNMEAGGDEIQMQVPPTEAAVAAVDEKLDVKTALRRALKSSIVMDGVAKGLHEAAKALDKRQAYFCVLAENCDEPMYTKLVEALCNEHQIPLVKIKDKKQLGEWIGLCKYDKEGKARKVVGCSCVVVRDYGQDDAARAFLQEYFDSQKKS